MVETLGRHAAMTYPLTFSPSPTPKRLTRHRYSELLRSRIACLIAEDSLEAKRLLESSPEHSPELNEIAMIGRPEEWADQVMMSDSMMILLNRIGWQVDGDLQKISDDELPSLAEIIEQL
jgi:hypothetical protein